MRSANGSSTSEACELALLLRSFVRMRELKLGACGIVRDLIECATLLLLLGSSTFFRRASPNFRRFLRFSTASSASRILASSEFTITDCRERERERSLGDLGTVRLLLTADPPTD